MTTTVIIEILISLVGYFIRWSSSKKESLEWMQKASETLREKGLVRAQFILKLEQDRMDYIESMIEDEPERPEKTPGEDTMIQIEEEKKPVFSPNPPQFNYVSGVSFKKRGSFKTRSGMPKGVLIHYTVSNRKASSAQAVMKSLARRGLGCPVMDENGVIHIPKGFDPLKDVGYHAGKSAYAGKSGMSLYMVGLEVCCWGRLSSETRKYVKADEIRRASSKIANIAKGDYQMFTQKQERAILDFIAYVKAMSPDWGGVEWVRGHDEVAVPLGRKTDPGYSLSKPMPQYREMLKQLL